MNTNNQFPDPPFGKILTAMVTPFNQEGAVDYEMAIKLACYLVENGSDGIVLIKLPSAATPFASVSPGTNTLTPTPGCTSVAKFTVSGNLILA